MRAVRPLRRDSVGVSAFSVAVPVPEGSVSGHSGRWLSTVGTHTLAGAAVGVALRAWMRVVSDDPEFTWSGSLFIVGAFVVLGITSGVVAAGRARGWRGALVGARAAGVVFGLACFGAAGAAMLISVPPGALALGRHDWPRWVRTLLAAVAVAGTVAIGLGLVEVPMGRRLVALPLFAAASAVEVRLFAELAAPSVDRLARPLRWALVAIPILLVVMVALTFEP